MKLKRLKDKLTQAGEAKVYIGYYEDQGYHDPSNLLYSDLMKIHEFGVNKNGVNIPPRPVLNLTQSGGIFLSEDKRVIEKAFKGFFINNVSLKSPLNSIGRYYEQKGKDIFGSSALKETVYGNPPLIDTGELSDKFSYRTSLTYKV